MSVSFKVPIPCDGACVFTGKAAIYSGAEEYFDDKNGHILQGGIPLSGCDKTANNLSKLPKDIIVTDSTWHYVGGGCC